MGPGILHLHTYFFFPFSIDKEKVLEARKTLGGKGRRWMDCLDDWLAVRSEARTFSIPAQLGPWRRAAYARFDMDSAAYQDMVFFHPIVRRVFFDTADPSGAHGGQEALLHCYEIPIPERTRVWFEVEDSKGRRDSVEVTDLRLFLFANGIGILSLGVEAFQLPEAEALWINETLRKVYPSSGRQIREGRIPSRMALVLERGDLREALIEEKFREPAMTGFLPPLSKIVTELLYFADYTRQEYEPVLDERMIVCTYFAVDPETAPPGFLQSEEYQALLSRFLYVDRDGQGFRYDPEFARAQMDRQLYRRWAHQGTYYGFTSYSSITATVGTFDCDEHQLREGFLVHRMFNTRYYLMTLVALFYRATLLDFSERTALVSKQLHQDQEDRRFSIENVSLANELRGDFLHFSNYWHFQELANKDEENEHFAIQCREYRIEPMKVEIEEEIEKLNASLHTYHQFRNTEAVNRLAMLSLMLGAGAVTTGFFGMNFGRDFGRLFFEPDRAWVPLHYAAILLVALMAFGAIGFGFYVVIRNWRDYRGSLGVGSPREAPPHSGPTASSR